MYTDHSLVTSAPTGSGKTVIFELAIVRLLMQSSDDMATGKIVYGKFLICLCTSNNSQEDYAWVHSWNQQSLNSWFHTYNMHHAVAPIKALCSERFEDWQAKFGPLGLRCCELTGDSQLDDYFELQNAQIVMTTPVCRIQACICTIIICGFDTDSCMHQCVDSAFYFLGLWVKFACHKIITHAQLIMVPLLSL